MVENRLSELDLMVVDDDQSLLEALMVPLGAIVGQVRCCGDVATVAPLLDRAIPDVMVLDVALADGDAFDVLDLLDRSEAMPHVIAISGMATPAESFRLAQRGVRGYLTKPFTVAALCRAIERVVSEPAEFRATLRCLVGQRALRDVERDVRTTMVDEALGRSAGTRKGAARLLQVSRQLVQHIVRGRS